ncbi:MAG: sugar phosphate isomerase/epimerase [Verrucomicrobia bacterium]|nr:sugar phosphate isomerase/epimerase [Verrucomicrobiota bacterium]
MKPNTPFSRRAFVSQFSSTAALMAIAPSAVSIAADRNLSRKRFKLAGFTKPFQNLSFEDTADIVAEIGWDGIECPVRKGGQVLPERVEEDLPKLVEALKKRNLELLTIATDIRNASDPFTERVVRTASKFGIKIYRLAHLRYNQSKPIPEQVREIRAGFAELAALNRELGICAAYENHSGVDSVGAAVWDMHQFLDGFQRDSYGICFDIGHATIEGGYAWPTNFRLVQPLLRAVYVKDFVWKRNGEKWKAEWCPLGDGMVSNDFFQTLKASAFEGPIVQHHEYPVGSGPKMINLMKKDLDALKARLIA